MDLMQPLPDSLDRHGPPTVWASEVRGSATKAQGRARSATGDVPHLDLCWRLRHELQSQRQILCKGTHREASVLPAVENITHIERDGARLCDPHAIRSQPGQHLSRYIGVLFVDGISHYLPRVVVGARRAVEQRGVDIAETLVAAEHERST